MSQEREAELLEGYVKRSEEGQSVEVSKKQGTRKQWGVRQDADRYRRWGKPQAVSINHGTYVMEMSDGENGEITMYGEIVETQPVDWWTGELIEGSYIIQDEFLEDLKSLSGARSLTIRMNSVGGDSGVSILIHNWLRELASQGTALTCVVDGVAMSGGSLIMCACDNVEVNPSSIIMVHKCMSFLFGGYNSDELKKLAAWNEAWDKAQVSIYKRKCSLSNMVISNIMAKTLDELRAENRNWQMH